MEFCLKWVHMARYELILRLDGALWFTIIFKPLLTPKRDIRRALAQGVSDHEPLDSNNEQHPFLQVSSKTGQF